MKTIYVKKHFQFDVREMPVPPMGALDVTVQVKTCALCGSDIRRATICEEYIPFGHEVAGIVEAVGSEVKNVKVGDTVCIESGTFDRFSDLSRNGKVDKDKTGRSIFNMNLGSMGFAEKVVAPCESLVKFDGMSFAEASMIEPMGVAYDLVKVTGIELGDDVMVYGIGPIGLLALRLARLSGARRIYAVDLSGRDARDELALKWGADKVIHTDKTPLDRSLFEKGGVDKVLVTAPPVVMPGAMKVMNVGGVMGFIGIGTDEMGDRVVSFDMRLFHDEKLQIRASNAVPALYFPACLELVRSGLVDVKALITHKLRMDHFTEDVAAYMNDRKGGLKAVLEI